MTLKTPPPIEPKRAPLDRNEAVTEYRLTAYLEKIERQHEWDRKGFQAPLVFWPEGRPSVAKDEARAEAMGVLSRFQEAAVEKREALEDRDVKEVARVSPHAAASYERDLRDQRDMAQGRAYEEFQHGVDRAMRRWATQDAERQPERKYRALERLGGHGIRSSDRQQPVGHAGGLKAHARRESALEEARRHRQQRSPSLEQEL